MSKAANERIAIVGGGITGLSCALILKQRGRDVTLFEASNRVGGRIRTIRLDKHNRELRGDEWNKTKDKLEFYAEFGPMRIEPDKQRLLKALLDYVEIVEHEYEPEDGRPYLKEFPPYTSPQSSHDPKFDLEPE